MPSTFEKWLAIRSKHNQERFVAASGLTEAAERYIEQHGTTVRYGPFSGMRYPLRSAIGRHSIHKMLGVVESELHPVFYSIKDRKYDVVIVIGSAEGYYAVGLAKLLNTKVFAYDPEPRERELCIESARLNGVSHLVEMRPLFTPADIAPMKSSRVLCVCDCEGFETTLFTPETVADTALWDLVIELHGPTVESIQALSWPHEISTFRPIPREEQYAELEGLGDSKKLLSEYRAIPQAWLWCEARVPQLCSI
jgi:hypothetical protein